MSARHPGANIAAQVLEVIDEYAIRDKIGYFTLDNADNNDTAMDDIGKTLASMAGGSLANVDAFERKLNGAAILTETEYELWQKKVPVGKIHILVTEIHRSDRLTYMLQDLQLDDIKKALDPKLRTRRPLSVVVDNDTRWLSQLYMIRRAMKLRPYLAMLRVKRRLQWEQAEKPKRCAPGREASAMPPVCRPELELTSNDWEVLEHTVTILGHYENAVKTLEGDGIIRMRKKGYCGSYGNIWDVTHGFEYLLEVLEHYKAVAKDFSEPEHFTVGINMVWEKLEKYYSKLNETPVYYAALAFHPAHRWSWFTDHWAERQEWVDEAKQMVQEVWDNSYRGLEILANTANEGPVAKRQKRYHNAFEEHCIKARRKPMRSDGSKGPFSDEYEAWKAQAEHGDDEVRDPLEYWHGKRLKYPRLSRMALDFLTIHAMSAECERIFSAAGRMVTPIRGSLDAQMIGICQVLRSWLRAGIVSSRGAIELVSLVREADDKREFVGSSDEIASEAASAWLLERSGQLVDEEKTWD